MDHVPMDNVNGLWNQTKAKNWDGLENVLTEHKEKAEGIDDALIPQMKQKIESLKDEGQDFPNSAGELYELLNEDSETDEE